MARIGDRTIAQADEDDLHLIARITGLSARTVNKRCRETRGNTLIRNGFQDRWPEDAEDFGELTVVIARGAGFEVELARLTGLSQRTVRKRLEKVNGRTLVRNAFPELDEEEEVVEVEEEEEEEWYEPGDGGDEDEDEDGDLTQMTTAQLLGETRVATMRKAEPLIHWLAPSLGLSARGFEAKLEAKHGRVLMRNMMGRSWPTHISDDGAEAVLAELQVATLVRDPPLAIWLANILDHDPDGLFEALANESDGSLIRSVYPQLSRKTRPEIQPTPPPPPAAGTSGLLVDGRWRVKRRLGSGNFGEAFEVIDEKYPEHGRFVLKRALGDDSVETLEKEMGLALRLSHQHICSYRDIGSDPIWGVYVILQYGGKSLDKLIERHGVFDVDDAVQIVSQIAAALDYAHGKGVLHQDVKPDNILIEGEEGEREARLTDFGISVRGRVTRRTGGAKTVAATEVIGYTPAYSAPEQRYGTPRRNSDQYSLALVFCSMLEGEVFVDGYEPRSISRLTARQNQAVARALASNPDARFARCSEFARQLGGLR